MLVKSCELLVHQTKHTLLSPSLMFWSQYCNQLKSRDFQLQVGNLFGNTCHHVIQPQVLVNFMTIIVDSQSETVDLNLTVVGFVVEGHYSLVLN